MNSLLARILPFILLGILTSQRLVMRLGKVARLSMMINKSL
jgi:branched-subunit amino acid transport protein AzlD